MASVNNDFFRKQLLDYFRGGQFTRWDKLLFLISPDLVYRYNAAAISIGFKELNKTTPDTFQKNVDVKKYSGNNKVAMKISEYLRANANDQLVGAYVHGSVGNSEEVPYSDFDGIVILKSSCFENNVALFRVVKALKETAHMMLEMDPLQHHGWFVLCEQDLPDYPENYFPHELFAHAACLFGSTCLTINLRKSGYGDKFLSGFNHLAESILSKLGSKIFLENRYGFKNFLSEFMLLPAVYFQAKTGAGVFKKFSFELLHKEPGIKSGVLDEISAVRDAWEYTAPVEFLRKLNSEGPYSSHKKTKLLSGKLPDELKNKFDDQMLGKMKDLVKDLSKRLQL